MHSIFLVALLATLLEATTIHYHIVPINSNDLCHHYTNETCIILNDLPSRLSKRSHGNIIISFLPGKHVLGKNVKHTGSTDITLNREQRQQNVKINCFHHGGFEFEKIKKLEIDGLEITGCKRQVYGGAIRVMGATTVSITNCRFVGNKVKKGNGYGGGGAVYVGNATKVFISDCKFTSNKAIGSEYVGSGGAIHVVGTLSLISSGNVYTNNAAEIRGGAVYVVTRSSRFGGDYFSNNSAGAIYNKGGTIEITNCTFKDNWHASSSTGVLKVDNKVNWHTSSGTGVVTVEQASVKISRKVSFLNNQGSLYLTKSQVTFQGTTTFTNNTGGSGGAITLIACVVVFKTSSRTLLSENTAKYGGGIFLEESTMNIFGNILITKNKATVLGGGVYAYLSTVTIEFGPEELHSSISSNDQRIQQTGITDNIAFSDGGGMYLSATTLKISNSYVDIFNNTARSNGGGMFLEQASRIYINKKSSQLLTRKVKLEFTNNSAKYGGAVYVSDTAAGVLCEAYKKSSQINLSSEQCFLQTLRFYLYKETNGIVRNTLFNKNTARLSGGDIYGGLLDRCTINPSAEIFHFDHGKLSNGIEYLKATASFNWAKAQRNNHHISSEAVRMCFCVQQVIKCDYTHPTVSMKKGEVLTLSVVVMDQVKTPLNGTLISSLLPADGGIGRFKEGQERQSVQNQCTELRYNVYSTADKAKVQLYAEGPCGNRGFSQHELNIMFRPCDCPIGFQPSSSSIDCACDCDTRLKPSVSNCSSINQTIQVVNDVWIKYVNGTNASGFVIQNCPFDYCVHKPVNISLTSPSEADKQCAYNRTGKICGECEKGLSLVFATSKCKDCANYYLFLLVPFAIAGIALVVLILLLNMTVATGTINGLIFYANILAANRSIFLPFNNPNVLTVFISWMNLDLGIEVCFYNGMNSYGKVLLQLAFPAYLIFLIVTIIALCEYSQRFSSLLGRRNPVATLCTLILLSYSKLIRTIIAALHFTTIKYPNGSHETVWLYDANVLYFNASHIPRFLAALFIFIIGIVYTVLLLFGQAFYRCSHHKMMKWVSHPKYDSFIKEYHAPLSPKHRYWVGLLLLARIIHYIISVFALDPVIILSAGIICLGLLLLKLRNERIYKNWLIDILETASLINLAVLSLGSFYVKVVMGNQQALACTSMAISLLIFIIIGFYHCFQKCGTKMTRLQQRVRDTLKQRQLYQPIPTIEDEDLSDEDEEYFEPELTQYTSDISNRPAADTRSRYYTQPIIRRAVRDDQLREPALDDLIPVQPEDYNVPPAPRPRNQQVTTYTEVDVRAD